jgi:putative ABC transport system permease protein
MEILRSFVSAFENIRSNLFHTFLSILGVVIGVAALVGMLSLIDGLEKQARLQILNTTDLQTITIQPKLMERVDEIWVKKENSAFISYEDLRALRTLLPDASLEFIQMDRQIITRDTTRYGVQTEAATSLPDRVTVLHGQGFREADIATNPNQLVISHSLAKRMSQGQPLQTLLNTPVRLKDREVPITGILDSTKNPMLWAAIPVTFLSGQDFQSNPPTVKIDVKTVEQVKVTKTAVESWLQERYPKNTDDFAVVTMGGRVDQLQKAFLLFRIIMGMIIGISVVVGGIGIMNVLLISVNKRVPEIGIRKAVGASKSDIVSLFMAESITISTLGCILGTLVGMGFVSIAVPIAKKFADVPFDAVFSLNTILVVTVTALLTGVVFGTYPALVAARYHPVDAIRRE